MTSWAECACATDKLCKHVVIMLNQNIDEIILRRPV